MSVNVTVGNGQGITQAIKAHLQKSGVKLTNVKLSDWQKVMDLVNQNQILIDKNNASNPSNKQDSIFTGGNDVSRIGANGGDNNWKTDFKVTAGQVMQFDAGIFNKIVAVLTGKVQDIETTTQPDTPTTPTTPNTPENDFEMPDLAPKPQSLSETVSNPIPKHIDIPSEVQKQTTENLIDQLGGKIIEREVNGEKREISVVKHDGETIRRVINEDGTLGDTLVPISTLGKNKYITQTEMDNKMRTALGLAEDAPIPDDIKGSFVSIGGQPTLIFKKDGKTLDNKQLKEYIAGLQTQQTQLPQGEGQEVVNVSEFDKAADNLFNVINNEYGDKKGNIGLEEYVNYELKTADPEVLKNYSEEQLRTLAEANFKVLDSNDDGEISKAEVKEYLEAANANGDSSVTDIEAANYAGEQLDESNDILLEKNVQDVAKQGYGLGQLDDGTYVYQKDGKTFVINPDGTLGEEIKSTQGTRQPQNEQVENAPVQNQSVNNAPQDPPAKKLTPEQVNEFISKDSRITDLQNNLENLRQTYESMQRQHDEAWSSHDFDKMESAPDIIEVGDAKMRYEAAQNAIKEYQEMIENWQDGQKYTLQSGEWAGSEFETTTLPNGQKGCVFEKIENGQKVKYYFNIGIDKDFGHVSLLGDMVERVVVEE